MKRDSETEDTRHMQDATKRESELSETKNYLRKHFFFAQKKRLTRETEWGFNLEKIIGVSIDFFFFFSVKSERVREYDKQESARFQFGMVDRWCCGARGTMERWWSGGGVEVVFKLRI